MAYPMSSLTHSNVIYVPIFLGNLFSISTLTQTHFFLLAFSPIITFLIFAHWEEDWFGEYNLKWPL